MSPPKYTRHALRRSVIASLLAAALLTACASVPRLAAPPAQTITSYTRPAAGVIASPDARNLPVAADVVKQSVVLGTAPQRDWWLRYRSPQLNAVVALALRNSLTLEVARANVARAEAVLSAAKGGRSVQVDLASDVGRRQYGADFLGPEAFTFPTYSEYSIGPSVSYDLDVFGGIRHRIEQAGAMGAYQRQELRAARLQVIGATVAQVLRIASVQAEIAAVDRILSADEKTLDLVRAARRSGVVSDIDVLTATSQRDHDRSLLPPLYQERDAARDALAILVGRPPSTWAAPSFALDQLSIPRQVDVVIPSELVRARPDIRAAGAELHGAAAAVGVATADLYPNVSLSAGWAEQGLLTGGTAAAWSVVGGLTAPIFHGGALHAQRRAAEDAYSAAFARYQFTVLSAFGQVADSLYSLQHDAQALSAEEQELASAEATVRLTQQGYRVGNAGILQVVTAERERQLAEIGLVQARTRRLADTATLFLASGSGA